MRIGMHCRKCPELCENRTQIVWPTGDPNSSIMFVGEAPGGEEDRKGEPFVGQAGKVFDRLLEQAGLERSGIFLTNVLKCRPPGNANPKAAQIRNCASLLMSEFETVRPRIVVSMGRFATNWFFVRFGFGRLVGIGKNVCETRTMKASFGDVVLFPMYHPAAMIYNPDLEEAMFKHFWALGKELEKMCLVRRDRG